MAETLCGIGVLYGFVAAMGWAIALSFSGRFWAYLRVFFSCAATVTAFLGMIGFLFHPGWDTGNQLEGQVKNPKGALILQLINTAIAVGPKPLAALFAFLTIFAFIMSRSEIGSVRRGDFEATK